MAYKKEVTETSTMVFVRWANRFPVLGVALGCRLNTCRQTRETGTKVLKVGGPTDGEALALRDLALHDWLFLFAKRLLECCNEASPGGGLLLVTLTQVVHAPGSPVRSIRDARWLFA